MKYSISVIVCVLFVSATHIFAQSPLQQAQNLLKAKEYSAALAPAQQAVRQDPKNVDALVLLGDVFDALDQQDSSAIYYFKAYDRDDDRADVLKKLALAYSAIGKHTDALKIAQAFVKDHKNDPFSYLTLSQVYVAASEQTTPEFANAIEKAQQEAFKAIKINKDLADGFVALGDINFARKVYELAKDNYEEALKRDNNLVTAHAKLAESYFRLGNLPGTSPEENIKFVNLSVQEWDKVTRADTNNVKAFYEKGRIQYRARQYKEAIPTLSRYASLKPDGWLGRWYLAESQYKVLKAEKVLDTAMFTHLEASKNIDSVKDRIDLMLAEVWLLNRDYKKSTSKYAELKASKGLDEVALENYAKASINAGDTTTAVSLYLEFFNKYPKSACKNALPIGSLLYNLKQYSTAIDVLRKKTDITTCPITNDADRNNVMRAYYYMGISYFSQKDKADSSIAPLQEALKLDSSANFVRLQLAQAYAETKKVKQAKEEWVKVTEMGKNNPKAKNEVSRSFQSLCGTSLREKNYSELQKYAQAWNSFDPNDCYSFLYLAISYYQSAPELALKNYKEVLRLCPENKDAKAQIDILESQGVGAAKKDAKSKKKGK